MPESSVQELEDLPPDAAVAGDHRPPPRRNCVAQREKDPAVGLIIPPQPRHELAGLVHHRGVKPQILDDLHAIRIREQFKDFPVSPFLSLPTEGLESVGGPYRRSLVS